MPSPNNNNSDNNEHECICYYARHCSKHLTCANSPERLLTHSVLPALPSFCCLVLHSVVPDLGGPMDASPPVSSVHAISQARILRWVAIPPPGDLPHPGIKPGSPTIAGRLLIPRALPSLLFLKLCAASGPLHSPFPLPETCSSPAFPAHPHGSFCPGLYPKSPPWRGLP